MDPIEVLKLYKELGINETIEDSPISAISDNKTNDTKPAMQKENNFISMNENDNKTFSSKEKISKTSLDTELAPPAKYSKDLVNNISTLEELYKTVSAFDKLAITKTATNTVFSDGNPNSEIMIIGEAPGAEEDFKSIPFCGKSGQLLDLVLSKINLYREKNFYITNTIFWRPPGNRAPTPEELEACLPFVKKHIAIIAPKLIILSGATAVKSLFKESNPEIAKTAITKLRGKFLEYKNEYIENPIDTIAVFHPSYLLRSPIQKKFIWEDMLRIKKHIDQKKIFI